MLLPQSLLAAAASASSETKLIACGVTLLFLVATFAASVVRSPLRRVPGPAASLFTSAVLRWHELRGERTRYVHALHLRYGPVVRLSPSEVSFTSAAAVKDIYNVAGSGFDKSSFYDLFTVYGRRTMFTTLDKESVGRRPDITSHFCLQLTSHQHARRRRILADRYANSNVVKGPSLAGIEERSQRVVELYAKAPGGITDIYVSQLAFSTGVLSEMMKRDHTDKMAAR